MSRILVISPVPTHPKDSGNRTRIHSFLSHLKGKGHQVYLLLVASADNFGNSEDMNNCWDGFYYHPYKRSRFYYLKASFVYLYERICPGRIIPMKIDDWYGIGMDEIIQGLHKTIKFDTVLVEYAYFSKAFNNFGGEVKKILDTHDVFGDRHIKFIENKQKPAFFYTSRAEEIKGLERADTIIAIQNREQRYFQEAVSKNVVTVGHLMDQPAPLEKVKVSGNKKLLYVGSANSVNCFSLKWFLEEVFPRIVRTVPDINFYIVGNVCDEFPKLPERCHGIGKVEDLAVQYRTTDVVINPMLFGTGLKIKSVEALAYGLPLVSTKVGCEGLEDGIGRAFLLGETPAEFADAVIKIMTDNDLYPKLSRNAYEYYKNYQEENIRKLLRIFE